MKCTGIIRRIDDLGRLVVPKEIRRNLRINEGDPFEIYTDNDMVCFKKYSFTPDLVKNAEALRDDIDLVICDEYRSTESKTVLKEASKLIQQAYEKMKYAERIERET